MIITEINHLEDCFNGSFIKEFVFSEKVSETFILHLGNYGKLDYFKSFARPFYKVVFPGDFYLKGVEGNLHARALLWSEENIQSIQEWVTHYQHTNTP